MIKTQLIKELSKHFPEMTLQEIKKAVDIIFSEISSALAKGNRIEFRGFGTFFPRYRKPRCGRNPRTGESVKVEGKYFPFFKAGKALRERINAPKSRKN